MSLTLVIWLLFFAGLAVLAFVRPVYGVSLYMLSYFLCPPFWWWGGPIASYRWNFYSGVILLVAVVFSRLLNPNTQEQISDPLAKRLCIIATLILLNATVVHFALSGDWTRSVDKYTLLAKFVLLFFLIFLSVRNKQDLRVVLLSIVVGAGYIGYEVTVNKRGKIHGNRLEGIGAPAARQANQFASLMVTLLPIAGALFLAGRAWERVAMIPIAPFIINVLLLCNSRGAFLGAILSGIAFLFLAPKEMRKKALVIVGMGLVATWFLLGDPRIVDRFLTTFADEGSRDKSAQSRFEYAKAGLMMVAEKPLGAGGDAFKKAHGLEFLRASDAADEAHAIHNGYINEACEWGLQGLALRLAFVGTTIILIFRQSRRAVQQGDNFCALVACALGAGMIGFLITCLFGDRLDNEWGYWVCALTVALSRAFSTQGLAVASNWGGATYGSAAPAPVDRPVFHEPMSSGKY